MYIHQISVFIENKPGNMQTLPISCRTQNRYACIPDCRFKRFRNYSYYCRRSFNTLTLLRDNDWICNLTHVIGVKLPDEPGSMAKAMNVIASNGYSVDYVYAFLARGTDDALMVFRVKDEDTDKVAALLVRNGMKTVDQEDLTKM